MYTNSNKPQATNAATETKKTRNTQSRARIKAAFTSLLGEKGFEAITVSDVTRRAGINRGTFYLHFVDKFDLLEQLEDEVIRGLNERLLSPSSLPTDDQFLFPYDTLLAALEYAQGDLEFVRAIAGPGGDAQFQTKLQNLIGSFFDQGLARSGLRLQTDVYPEAYARALAMSHVLTIVNLWLERGGTEPCEDVAAMICSAKDVRPLDLIS